MLRFERVQVPGKTADGHQPSDPPDNAHRFVRTGKLQGQLRGDVIRLPFRQKRGEAPQVGFIHLQLEAHSPAQPQILVDLAGHRLHLAPPGHAIASGRSAFMSTLA